MFKNALKFLNKAKNNSENLTIVEEPKSLGLAAIRSFRTLVSEYLTDVAFNNGELSQEIYDKFLSEYEWLKQTGHFPYAEQQYEKALEIINNYRTWEAEKLGWK